MSDVALLFCAIDIGTSFSGYAFAPRENLAETPSQIFVSNWENELLSYKTPTSLLLDSSMTFHSFGHDAVKKYAELAENEEHADWYFFQDFKMELSESAVTRDLSIQDIDGKCVNALRVFADCIQFLRGHFMDCLNARNLGITEKDICYVVTVPAIWSDAAKQFMKEAAIKAGISADHLRLAYEPEAAAVYCKQLPKDHMVGKDDPVNFIPNQSYVVVDLGGGTVDITVQQVSSLGQLENLHKASGGPWGGNNINKFCLELYNILFRKETVEEFCKENMDDFFDILQKIEIVKRKISPDKEKTIILEVPVTLLDKYKESCRNKEEASLDRAVREANLQDVIRIKKGNKLLVKNVYFLEYFQEICQKTVDLVKNIIRSEQQCQSVKSIILVGGFAESEVVQCLFKDSFPEYNIKIPFQAGLAVLKGAVIFGFDSSIIKSRKCPYTYGISLLRKFNPQIDDRSKSCMMGNQLMADCVFDKVFEENEVLTVGTKHFIRVKINHEGNSRARFEPKEIEVYSSNKKSPKYTTDSSCHRCGLIQVPPPNGRWPELVEGRIEVKVTGTDSFQITYSDGATGLSTIGQIDFLSPGQIEKD